VLQQSITPRGRVRLRIVERSVDAKPRIAPQTPPSQPAAASVTIFLSAQEAAAFLRISPVTLGRWRIEGHGPRFAKFGRRVLYARSELLAWARAQTRQSTSEQ
jgi:predicted DNA-binding transcriptional regulator AlpA